MFETLAPFIIAGLLFTTGYMVTRWAAVVDVAKHWKAIATSLADNIDGMREEGCAAQGALEEIFNGVTAGGMPHSKLVQRVADIAAEVLAMVPVCEHKEEAEDLANLVDRLADDLIAARLSQENWQNLAVESEERAEEAERLLGLVNDKLVVAESVRYLTEHPSGLSNVQGD